MEPWDEMLDLFASVGSQRFHFTKTNIYGENRGFFGNRDLNEAKRTADILVKRLDAYCNNLIVRPDGPLIQLDDLSRENALKIHRHSFAIVKTSDGNFQAWLAVPHASDDLRRRLCKGLNADIHASGSVRLAGTKNYKVKYAPDFPVVTIPFAQPGHEVSQALLESFLAPTENRVSWVARVSTERPDYATELAHAPKAHSGKADRSQADWLYCVKAIASGMSQEEVASTLMRESPKAKERGTYAERYCRLTARNAAISLGRGVA